MVEWTKNFINEPKDDKFCSCEKPEIIETHVCISRVPDEKDKYKYCRKCKKEKK